jgi:hypothetical protein
VTSPIGSIETEYDSLPVLVRVAVVDRGVPSVVATVESVADPELVSPAQPASRPPATRAPPYFTYARRVGVPPLVGSFDMRFRLA